MKILSIETSCDETAVAVLECEGTEPNASFRILGNALRSQIDIHKEYGGVYPALAKRAHAENLVPLLEKALEDAKLLVAGSTPAPVTLAETLEREPVMHTAFTHFLSRYEKPAVDAVAVTYGPGLEPALWVGVNLARALAHAWGVKLIGVNHMEGHFLAGLGIENEGVIELKEIQTPVLGLLISGGHTELDLMNDWRSYECLGKTRDDAVGEAFDKVARMLELPYPGGPEISKLAEAERAAGTPNDVTLPRPMMNTEGYDFSFSGLKTAVLYALKEFETQTEEVKMKMARAFEDAATDVLWSKTRKALEVTGAKTLVLGGGVSANRHIRKIFAEGIAAEFPEVSLRIPAHALTTDNAVMIGIAGYYRALAKDFKDPATLRANGNLSLA